jgi:hypothetical protein
MKTLLCVIALSICGLAQCQPVDPCIALGTCYTLPPSITALTFTGPADTQYVQDGKFEPLLTIPLPEQLWLPPAHIIRPYCMFVHAGGGTPPYTFSASGLPAGLVLDPNGWLHGIVGQPHYVYNYTVTFTVKDAAGAVTLMTKKLELCWGKSYCTGQGK